MEQITITKVVRSRLHNMPPLRGRGSTFPSFLFLPLYQSTALTRRDLHRAGRSPLTFAAARTYCMPRTDCDISRPTHITVPCPARTSTIEACPFHTTTDRPCQHSFVRYLFQHIAGCCLKLISLYDHADRLGRPCFIFQFRGAYRLGCQRREARAEERDEQNRENWFFHGLLLVVG